MSPKNNSPVKPFGLWQSPLALEEWLSQPPPPMYPFQHNGRLFWLEALGKEGGRIALMSRTADDKIICITPSPFNIRTNAHEYGGNCFCVCGDEIFFNNFSDGRLYRQALTADAKPEPVTKVTKNSSFADLVPLNNDVLIAIRESEDGASEARDELVAIFINHKTGNATPQVLAAGADFYACPRVSPNGTRLAWLEWEHPFMPWDESRLVTATVRIAGDAVEIGARQVVVGQSEQAVCQPGFLDDERLAFVSDGGAGGEFWNFYIHKDNKIQQITDDTYEYGEGHWQFGQQRWQAVGAHILAVGSAHDGDRLLEISTTGDGCRVAAEGFATCAHLQIADDELLFIANYAARNSEIRSISPSRNHRAIYTPLANITDHAQAAEAIEYPTRDGERAFAYFYSPDRQRAPANTKPPLLVVVHGGPTGRATPEFHPLKQFFASLGFALLDVNHRGSTGYGRAYRQRLLGEWGRIDADDIADGVNYLIAQDLVDREAIFIRGGSAGGYAVLRMLTEYPQMFCGGACYYGIGNLITLARATHKFEGHYTDRLIGEKFDPRTDYNPQQTPDSRFVTRSPIFNLDQLNCPLILFQGLLDKVVPPALSREVADILENKGIRYEYVEYEDEGHGFRHLPNRVDSLRKETAFFASILSARG